MQERMHGSVEAATTGGTGRGHSGGHMKPGDMNRDEDRRMELMLYLRFLAMIATSMIVMYAVTYLNTFELDHVRWSEQRVFMVLLMGASMAVVMLAWMLGMYRNWKANAAIVAGAIAVFALGTFLVRSEATVQDRSYMSAMIPHHSIAILTSTRAELDDVRVRELADEIIEAQKREIEEMNWLLADIDANGEATTAAEGEAARDDSADALLDLEHACAQSFELCRRRHLDQGRQDPLLLVVDVPLDHRAQRRHCFDECGSFEGCDDVHLRLDGAVGVGRLEHHARVVQDRADERIQRAVFGVVVQCEPVHDQPDDAAVTGLVEADEEIRDFLVVGQDEIDAVGHFMPPCLSVGPSVRRHLVGSGVGPVAPSGGAHRATR